MSLEIAVPDARELSRLQASEIERAELRWVFAKTFIEPRIAEASNDEDAKAFLPNHEYLIRRPDRTLCVVKSRKVAHSWAIALKALSRAATQPRSTTIIGSYDEDEAKEKIEFLDWQFGVLPKVLRQELSLSGGSETKRFANGSRIRFISRKAPTGPGASIEWDEFSVEKPGTVSASAIMVAALGCTTHGGQVSIGGTQRGADTLFNQIVSGEINEKMQSDPLWKAGMGRAWAVKEFPWWTSPALSLDPREAARLAVRMATEERVGKYGNEKLLDQYRLYKYTPDLGEEMFKREFECHILEEAESYYPHALLDLCYSLAGVDYWFLHCNVEGANYGRYGDALAEAKALVDQLALAIGSRALVGDWSFAMDIGRTSDRDEIFIGQSSRENREMLYPRLNISMDLMEFEGKREIIHYIYSKIPITRGYIDATPGSMGVQLSEEMHKRYGQRCAPFTFNNTNKQILASGVKSRMGAGLLALPKKTRDYDLLERQILKVKKVISKTGNVVFDVVRNKKDGHGDKFWSLAMLCELTTHAVSRRPRRPAVGSYRPSGGLVVGSNSRSR